MTTDILLHDFAVVERSGSAAVLSVQTAQKVRSFTKAFQNVVLVLLATAVSVPLLFLLWVVLSLSVWRLGRLRPYKVALDADNYKDFRLRFAKITALGLTLQPITQLDLSKRNWVVRSFLSQAVKAAIILQRHQAEMTKVLQKLDEPYGPISSGWQILTSDDRLGNRPKPYEYLV